MSAVDLHALIPPTPWTFRDGGVLATVDSASTTDLVLTVTVSDASLLGAPVALPDPVFCYVNPPNGDLGWVRRMVADTVRHHAEG